MKKNLGVILISMIVLLGCEMSTDNMRGYDIRLFRNVAWDLAQAVKKQDTVEIKKILSKGKINVDVREPKFGQTLLIWAVWQRKYHSAEILLKYNADPNLQGLYDGESAMHEAADNFDTSKFLRLVLKYGGNPNNIAKGNHSQQHPSPLIIASGRRLESVKILVEAGADINYTDKRESALRMSSLMKRADIVRYLLIEKGAEFKKPLFISLTGEKIYITEILRDWPFPLDSKDYRIKMEIVDFLKKHGMDYRKTSIPEQFKRNYSPEYLEKY